jgi:hypothetical protein
MLLKNYAASNLSLKITTLLVELGVITLSVLFGYSHLVGPLNFTSKQGLA